MVRDRVESNNTNPFATVNPVMNQRTERNALMSMNALSPGLAIPQHFAKISQDHMFANVPKVILETPLNLVVNQEENVFLI